MDEPQNVLPGQRSLPEGRRRIGDHDATRDLVYDNAAKAAASLPPVANSRFSVSLHDVGYEGRNHFTTEEQKKARLTGGTLSRRLRGTVRLSDVASGDKVDEKRVTLANIPHLSNNGLFTIDGSPYSLSHQLRLMPGIYTRRRENGETEAHINVLPGKGLSHRIFMDPASGVFRARFGQSNVPLITVLRAMGTTDQELQSAWGPELTAVNHKHDSAHHEGPLLERLVRGKLPDDAPTRRQALSKALESMELDPEVTKATLGKAFPTLSKEALLTTTQKLLKVSRGEVDPDDRDHMAFQHVMGPEDLVAERIARDRGTMSKLLWQATFRGNLGHVGPGVFDRAVRTAFLGSGLGIAPEGVNAAEFLDHGGRITRLGEGGLSGDAIPDSSRSVHPSQAFFIDPIRTPESGTVGVDMRLAYGAQKGADGRIYAPFRDPRDGRLIYRSPQQVSKMTVAFPGEFTPGKKHVAAIDNGKLRLVKRNKVDLIGASAENLFSPLSNLVPLKASVKGQRLSMGARFLTQAVSLLKAEAPHVRSEVPGQPGKSFEELYGKHMGAVHAQQPGVVESVDANRMVVKHTDGTKQDYELHDHHPIGRKSGIHNTPLVQVGQQVQAGQPLAKSNYTDNQGHAALGLNTRIAYVPYQGKAYEDSVIISDSYSKRSSSDHYYHHPVEYGEHDKTSKRDWTSLFPGKYDKKTLESIGDDGVIKQGSVVNSGQPLVLKASPRDVDHAKITRSGRGGHADQTVTWDHHNPGVVTDVVRTRDGGVNAIVRTYAPSQEGDKFCYDSRTEVLTDSGWVPMYQLTDCHNVATLQDGKLVYALPIALHRFHHNAPMYRLKTRRLDLLVTHNHRLYARPLGKEYDFVPAEQAVGRRLEHMKGIVWEGKWEIPPGLEEDKPPRWSAFPGLALPALDRKPKHYPAVLTTAEDYAEICGMCLACGRLSDPHHPTGVITFRLKLPEDLKRCRLVLERLGIRLHVTDSTEEPLRIRFSHAQFVEAFRDCLTVAHALDLPARIPERCYTWPADLIKKMLEWLIPDGQQFAELDTDWCADLQRLCLLAGLTADVRMTRQPGKRYLDPLKRLYSVVLRDKPTAEANGDEETVETWEDAFAGMVYCPTVPGGVIYVRRNGSGVWCGNSNLYGGKGIAATVMPDHQMPHDEQGRPFEMVVSPLGLLSRVNPSWVAAGQLGKISAQTGKPYVVPDFHLPNLTQYAADELKKHGLSDTETITDPSTGRQIPGVLTGNNFMLKLHHLAEGKSQGHSLGNYNAEGAPQSGGGNAKRLSISDSNALVSHGAYGVLRDSRENRGQRNEEFWLSYMGGFPPPHAKVSAVYEKFINQLKAGGINVVREGPRLRLMAMTNRDVQELAADRKLKNAETVAFDDQMKPVPGGLFSPELTGGHGNQSTWSKIELHEPMPNPVFAEPIRRLLGMTEKDYRKAIETNPEGLAQRLKQINVNQEIEQARRDITSGRKGRRDTAVRKLGYLKSLERTGQHPGDWMMNAVPVLPPGFRPVSQMHGGGQLVDDANLLYKEVFDANENLKHLHGKVADLSAERGALYKAFEGAVGLGDPTHPKNVERGVRGILKQVFGPSAKYSIAQRKLLGTPVDLSGRGVIAPDPNLNMDEVGIPEDKAFEVFRPFVVRHLVRNGVPRTQALKMVEEKNKQAQEGLLEVMKQRPVILNRYPLLHKYGEMAFYAKPVKGDTIRVSPIIVKPYGADFDGDAASFHVPVSDDAVRDAHEKMLPSKNLLAAATMKTPLYTPQTEFLQGIHAASAAEDSASPRVFADRKSAMAAYRRGEIGLGQKVEVIEK